MKARHFALLAGALALAPSTVSAAPTTLTAEKSVLPNGLELILDEDHRTPIVTVNIWYHVGSKDEAAHRNGFAHLFEHIMFQGSKHVPEDTYFKDLEKVGATSINGTTNQDRTNYFETVPANQLELALWLESDRMGFLLDHADQKTFESQREVVKNERRQNYENAPYGYAPAEIHAQLYPVGHPYHLLTIGTPEDLDAATLDDVRAFFRKNYVPNNATLVISGDIDKAKTKALVTKYFGPIPKAPDVPKLPLTPVTHPGETVIEMEANVEQARVYIDWPTPAFFQPGDSDLDLVSHVLTGGKTSRLYKKLVYDLQIAQAVAAHQSSSQLASNFEIVATAKTGHTAQELLKAIDDELATLRSSGIKPEEIARGKTTITSGVVFELEDSSSRANTLNNYNHYVGDPNYFDKDLARTNNATTDTVMAAAKTYLKEHDRVVTLFTPNKSAPIAGKVVKMTGGK